MGLRTELRYGKNVKNDKITMGGYFEMDNPQPSSTLLKKNLKV